MVENIEPVPVPPPPSIIERALYWMGTTAAQVLRSRWLAWLPRHRSRRRGARMPFPRVDRSQIWRSLPEYPPPPPTRLPPPGDLCELTARFPILHSDDDHDVMQLIRLMLERRGLTVLSVAGAAEALRICEAAPISLVITDIMKPDMDGFTMVRALRENPVTTHIPVIFLSARSMVDDRIAGLRLGAIHYLTKPCTPDELYNTVAATLTQYGNWQAPPRLDVALCYALAERIEQGRWRGAVRR